MDRQNAPPEGAQCESSGMGLCPKPKPNQPPKLEFWLGPTPARAPQPQSGDFGFCTRTPLCSTYAVLSSSLELGSASQIDGCRKENIASQSWETYSASAQGSPPREGEGRPQGRARAAHTARFQPIVAILHPRSEPCFSSPLAGGDSTSCITHAILCLKTHWDFFLQFISAQGLKEMKGMRA